MKFCNLVALLSVLVHCVFQVLASKCSTHLIITIISSDFFEDCPSVNVIWRVYTTKGSSSNWISSETNSSKTSTFIIFLLNNDNNPTTNEDSHHNKPEKLEINFLQKEDKETLYVQA